MNNKLLEQAKKEVTSNKRKLVPNPILKSEKEKKSVTLTTVLTPSAKEKLNKISKEYNLSIAEVIAQWIENTEI